MSLDQVWMDEISLDPSKPWLQMGTRQLGQRPWLVSDNDRLSQLGLKHQLLATIPDAVLADNSEAAEAGFETLEFIEQQLNAGQHADDAIARHERLQDELMVAGLISQADGVPSSRLSSLDLAGRLVQEDLCLLQRSPDGWLLQAASLCFPSRWRLADKIKLPLGAVHSPVPGYDRTLASRVDSLLDRLDDKVVWRRNWFIHPDASLYQPDRPPNGDPIIPSDRCGKELILRSERQTLRILPRSGWCLFTIRTQQAPLGEFVSASRIGSFVEFIDHSAVEDLDHRGLSSRQIAELRAHLLPVDPP